MNPILIALSFDRYPSGHLTNDFCQRIVLEFKSDAAIKENRELKEKMGVLNNYNMEQLINVLEKAFSKLDPEELVPSGNKKENWTGFLYDLADKARKKAEEEKWTYKRGYEWASENFLFKGREIKPENLKKSYDNKYGGFK
ncbi:MAG: hypothetical protein JW870_15580 [Candidatus Delongbacteria bacterium]|nr:hypothetical protein [Candidatus Delongbacteria bacterium]